MPCTLRESRDQDWAQLSKNCCALSHRNRFNSRIASEKTKTLRQTREGTTTWDGRHEFIGCSERVTPKRNLQAKFRWRGQAFLVHLPTLFRPESCAGRSPPCLPTRNKVLRTKSEFSDLRSMLVGTLHLHQSVGGAEVAPKVLVDITSEFTLRTSLAESLSRPCCFFFSTRGSNLNIESISLSGTILVYADDIRSHSALSALYTCQIHPMLLSGCLGYSHVLRFLSVRVSRTRKPRGQP